MGLKEAIRRSRKKIGPSNDPVSSFMLDFAEGKIEELFAPLQEEMRQIGVAEAIKAAGTIKKGDAGVDGRSIVGPQGPQGEKGDTGDSITGPQGEKGDKGDTGDSMLGEKGKDGTAMDKAELAAKLNQLNGAIEIKTIKGLELFLKNIQRVIREKASAGARKHGGGMTLTAGSNITLVRNSNGTWTIANTGGSGGSNIATEVVTAVASGTNVTIDLTQLAHVFSTVEFTSKNGQVLMPIGNAGLPGSSWSISGSTITVYNADPSEIFIVQYIYA